MSESHTHLASSSTSTSLFDCYSTSPRNTTTLDADINSNPSLNSNVNSNVNHNPDLQPRMSPSYITHQRRPALIPPDITLCPSDEQSVRMRTGHVNPYTDLDRYRHNIRSSIYVGVSPSIRCGFGRMARSVGSRVEGTENKDRDGDGDGDGKAEHQNKEKDGEENGCGQVFVKKRKRMASSADDVEMEELAEGTVEDEEMKDIKMKV